MQRTIRTTILAAALLLAGCPSSDTATVEDPISTAVFVNPQKVVIGNDEESATLQKEFQGPLGTTFSENNAQVNITVSEAAAANCPSQFESCEQWNFTSAGARPGIYSVEAFRNIVQPGGAENRAFGILDVVVVPQEPGNAGAASLGFSPTPDVVTTDGPIWTFNANELLAESGVVIGEATPSFDAYSTKFGQPVDAPALDNVASFSSNGHYGVALLNDGSVVHWGAALGPDEVNRPQPFAELNEVLATSAADGFFPVSVVVDAYVRSTDPLTGESDSLAALLLNDGGVIAWYGNPVDETNPVVQRFDGLPLRINGFRDAVAVTIYEEYIGIIRSNGEVWEMNRVSGKRDANVPAVIVEPRRVEGIVNATLISGRKASDTLGNLSYWGTSTSATQATTATQLIDVPFAQALPDPAQNVMIQPDGTLTGFRAADRGIQFLQIGAIGRVAAVSKRTIIDAPCGRVWTTNLYDAFSPDPGGIDEPLISYPRIGFGGNARCENGAFSHLVFFIVTGDGSGTIQPPTGTVDCRADAYLGQLCWWFGENDTSPVFTAVPDEGSTLRDWRWDCASANAASQPVQQTLGTSQNLCKVTFIADEGSVATPPDRQLTIAANGMGTINLSDNGASCGDNCSEYADGTTVTLTATPEDMWMFDDWENNGCVQNFNDASIAVTMNSDKTCIANFSPVSVGTVPPVASFTISPQQPVEPGTVVTFDASASSDADGSIVSWDWDLVDDGVVDAQGEVVTFTYPNAGYLVVRLVVTDNDGLTDEATGIIDIVSMLSEPPVAAFDIAPSTSEVLGTTFAFDASASTDDVGIAGYSWDFDGNLNFVDASGEQVTFAPTVVGDYDIVLQVTDTDGQFVRTTRTITVLPAPSSTTYTLEVVLTGSGQVDIAPLNITLPNSNCDGDQCFIFDIPENTQLTLDAAAFTPAAFQGWSATECDAIPSSERCVITMDTNRSVNAAFQ